MNTDKLIELDPWINIDHVGLDHSNKRTGWARLSSVVEWSGSLEQASETYIEVDRLVRIFTHLGD